VAAGLSLAATPGLLRATEAPANRPVIRISSGELAGTIENGAFAFKGIPYGEPTGGAARFLPSAPRAPWEGVRDASRFAHRSPQRGGPGGSGSPNHSEDCLVANVWTPSLSGSRPVMVWFHGGGWEVGGSDDPVTNGAWLARQRGVVVVSINHRLNVFGYLNLAAIGGERYAASGNAGALDMALALAWVRENIERFGGDADRVTIFGQSGGGRKTTTLMAMPAAAGLFHRAISQSGPGLTLDTPDIGHDRADRLLRKLGLSRGEVSRLADVPVERLTAAGIEVRNETGQFRPFVDGAVVLQHPYLPQAPLLSADVPLMVGTTRDETAVFLAEEPEYATLSDADLLRHAERFFPQGQATAAIAQWKRAFPESTNAKLFAQLTTDRSYFLDATLLAESKAALRRAPAYLYIFERATNIGTIPDVSPHGMELPFVFGNLAASRYLKGVTRGDEALRDAVSGAWTAFARSGRPDHPGIPQWLPYDPALRATMMFGPTVRLEADPYAARREFMAQLGSEQLAPYEPRPPGPWIRP
jgi:para-nitrobenzyl esterase